MFYGLLRDETIFVSGHEHDVRPTMNQLAAVYMRLPPARRRLDRSSAGG